VGGACQQCAEDKEVERTLQQVYARGRLAFHCVTSLHYHCVACLRKGIGDRDLEPENILVARDDRRKIPDFGSAKLAHLETVIATV
jgi:serine/threonine protein kinase